MKKPGAMLGEVLAHVFRKPATSRYPFVKALMPENFRGKLVTTSVKCVGCKLCARDCPANALTVTKVADKQFEVSVDLDKCIYCGQCVDSCARKVLHASREFELASLDRSTLKVRVEAEKVEPAAEEAPAAGAKPAAEANPVVAAKPADGAKAETAAR